MAPRRIGKQSGTRALIVQRADVRPARIGILRNRRSRAGRRDASVLQRVEPEMPVGKGRRIIASKRNAADRELTTEAHARIAGAAGVADPRIRVSIHTVRQPREVMNGIAGQRIDDERRSARLTREVHRRRAAHRAFLDKGQSTPREHNSRRRCRRRDLMHLDGEDVYALHQTARRHDNRVREARVADRTRG